MGLDYCMIKVVRVKIERGAGVQGMIAIETDAEAQTNENIGMIEGIGVEIEKINIEEDR